MQAIERADGRMVVRESRPMWDVRPTRYDDGIRAQRPEVPELYSYDGDTGETERRALREGDEGCVVVQTYVGPDVARHGQVVAVWLAADRRGWPGNSDHTRRALHGWRGTTDDMAVVAHGWRRVESINRPRDGFAVRVVLSRDEAKEED